MKWKEQELNTWQNSQLNNKEKIFYVTIFVYSISRKFFCQFKNSNKAEETINAKRNMERDTKACGVKIKASRVDMAYLNSLSLD